MRQLKRSIHKKVKRSGQIRIKKCEKSCLADNIDEKILNQIGLIS
jgi:hypothetical protein